MNTPTDRGQQAADDLAAVREQWGDLLAAISEPPRPAEWMPYERRGFLDQLAADDRAGDEPTVGRLPLVVREHPAPANLRALDAALAVESDLFAMCDAVAEQVQRTVDRDDPRLWSLPTVRAAEWRHDADRIGDRIGSRAHGLHWACVYLAGRALSELDGELFRITPAPLLDQIAAVAGAARRRVEGALGREGRTLTLDDRCPFCKGGMITVHNGGGDPRAAVATCSTGSVCPAPVDVERGRRAWRGADLVALWVAINARRTVPA
ncbi:hypothetical protein [Streptomyces shenzhenensis]|uniref:LigA protein n=1 Tax=Streptomyces shenzhenensis TaxID=943815 RepID=A0A3M0I4A8_9ACTN|nr:hypothetical protein [Streptomyces shenzhenensis]RMB83665.1 hypothetical protein CTZ28_23395 [Streptomyces shenzhenensis]